MTERTHLTVRLDDETRHALEKLLGEEPERGMGCVDETNHKGEITMTVRSMMTVKEFRSSRPEYEDDFKRLTEEGYEFDGEDLVEIVAEGSENGGHLLLHGPGYSVQFSQSEPVASIR